MPVKRCKYVVVFAWQRIPDAVRVTRSAAELVARRTVKRREAVSAVVMRECYPRDHTPVYVCARGDGDGRTEAHRSKNRGKPMRCRRIRARSGR